jgi:hypothetical protein
MLDHARQYWVLFEPIGASISHWRLLRNKEIESPRFYPVDRVRDINLGMGASAVNFTSHSVFHNFLWPLRSPHCMKYAGWSSPAYA